MLKLKNRLLKANALVSFCMGFIATTEAQHTEFNVTELGQFEAPWAFYF